MSYQLDGHNQHLIGSIITEENPEVKSPKKVRNNKSSDKTSNKTGESKKPRSDKSSNTDGHSSKVAKPKTKLEAKQLETAIIEPGELVLQEKIGKGNFGVVWKGKCRGVDVAIKKLHAESFDPNTLEEIKKEVALMTHLHHPNIILFMGACLTPGHLAIVTEYMSRGDLHDIIHDSSNKLSFFQKCLMTRDITAGMTWLHENNPPIIHRDLKPRNMLVGQNYEVKLCDFGLSVYRIAETLRDKDKAPGTPLWMAPEVMLGKDITEKCDTYAYGIVLWELFSELEPFTGHDNIPRFRDAVCHKHERPPITNEMITTGKMTNDLATLIKLCWDPSPANRPPMGNILPQIYDILLKSELSCPDAIAMWKTHWPEKQEVPYINFATVLYKVLGEKDFFANDVKNICLEMIVCKSEEGGALPKEKMVTLERFGCALSWFGPLKVQGRLGWLHRLTNLMKYNWFHGDIDRNRCENLLRQAKKNSFLVRFSYTSPTQTPFTLSKITSAGLIHQRLYAQPDSTGYYCFIQEKNRKDRSQIQISELGELTNLVKAIGRYQKLENPILGSPYESIFLQKTPEATGQYWQDEKLNEWVATKNPKLDS